MPIEFQKGARCEGLEDDGLFFLQLQGLRLRIRRSEKAVVCERQECDQQGCIERCDCLGDAVADARAVLFEVWC